MRQIVYTLFTLFFITSCNGSREKAENKDEPISFTTEKYDKTSELSNHRNAELKAEIPVAEGDSTIAKNINEKIFGIIRSIVGQENDKSTSYTELFNGFIHNYEQFIKESPDSSGGWEATIKGTIGYENSDVINLVLDSYIMTGGAHGIGYKTSLFFDPKTGKELPLRDIINDVATFSKLAESRFREKYNIIMDKSINSTGLMFDNNRFVLPQNIIIAHDGLLLYYNVYEIAPYAEGVKEVVLPYSDIENYLAIKIK